MDIVITEWALQSYLDLRGDNVFNGSDYRDTIRPDVERLRTYGTQGQDTKFSNHLFWGRAVSGGAPVAGGFKMKWHNLGPGCVQLRLLVAMKDDEALLCTAYVKDSDRTDRRQMALFSYRTSQIHSGHYTRRGQI